MFGTTTYKYASNFLGTGLLQVLTNYSIFKNLSKISNLIFDCNFLKHTGHNYKGFTADYL